MLAGTSEYCILTTFLHAYKLLCLQEVAKPALQVASAEDSFKLQGPVGKGSQVGPYSCYDVHHLLAFLVHFIQYCKETLVFCPGKWFALTLMKCWTMLISVFALSASTLHHIMQGYDFPEFKEAKQIKPAKKGQFFQSSPQSTSQVSCRPLCLCVIKTVPVATFSCKRLQGFTHMWSMPLVSDYHCLHTSFAFLSTTLDIVFRLSSAGVRNTYMLALCIVQRCYCPDRPSLRVLQRLQLEKQRRLHHQVTLSRDLLQNPRNLAKQLPAKPRKLLVQLLTLPRTLYPQGTL